MRKWLQDPKIVAGLGVFAICYMVYTFLPEKRTSHKISLEETPAAPSTAPQELQPPIQSFAEFDHSGRLDSIAWKRKANRDPFVSESRSGEMAYWVLGKTAPVIPKVKGNREKRKVYRLQAVAIGPAGKLAMVNQVWYAEGEKKNGLVFKSIASDSVVVIENGTKRVFRFSSLR